MIELDEKDIKAIARSRFVRKTEKKLVGVLISAIVAFLLIIFLLREDPTNLIYLGLVPLVGLCGYMIWYLKKIYTSEKELVEEWKQDVDKSV